MYFFCEADRGTMTVKRFTLKLKAYAAYWKERNHEERFGIRYFRVLTVTTSAVRSVNLVAATEADEELRPLGRMFPFTDDAKLRLDQPESILESIWTTPTSRESYSLLESGSIKTQTERRTNP